MRIKRVVYLLVVAECIDRAPKTQRLHWRYVELRAQALEVRQLDQNNVVHFRRLKRGQCLIQFRASTSLSFAQFHEPDHPAQDCFGATCQPHVSRVARLKALDVDGLVSLIWIDEARVEKIT